MTAASSTLRVLVLLLTSVIASQDLAFAGQGETAWESANREISAALDSGDLAAARRSAETAVQIAQKAFGPSHMKTAVALRKLAEVQRVTGDPGPAAGTLDRAAELWAVNLGASHPYSSEVLIQAARDRETAKDLAGASAALQKALDTQKKYYGPRHTVVAATLQEMTRIQREAEDWDAARRSEAEAADIFLEALGPAHVRTLKAFEVLAGHAVERGNLVLARNDLKHVLSSAAAAARPPLEALASVYVLNGDLAFQDKDLIAAGESYARALELLERLGGASKAERLQILYKMRELYQSAGKEEAAAQAAERARLLESAPNAGLESVKS